MAHHTYQNITVIPVSMKIIAYQMSLVDLLSPTLAGAGLRGKDRALAPPNLNSPGGAAAADTSLLRSTHLTPQQASRVTSPCGRHYASN